MNKSEKTIAGNQQFLSHHSFGIVLYKLLIGLAEDLRDLWLLKPKAIIPFLFLSTSIGQSPAQKSYF